MEHQVKRRFKYKTQQNIITEFNHSTVTKILQAKIVLPNSMEKEKLSCKIQKMYNLGEQLFLGYNLKKNY